LTIFQKDLDSCPQIFGVFKSLLVPVSWNSLEGYTNTAPSCVAFRHLILHLRPGAPLAVTNSNSRGTGTEASTTNRTPEADISAMTHRRSAIPPIPIHAPEPELRRGEERLSLPFRLKNPPKLTFFIIIAPSNRLNVARGWLCRRDPLRFHASVAEPLQRQTRRLGNVRRDPPRL
jgi:hypothetical protein